MDRLRLAEAGLLIGILSVSLSVFQPTLHFGSLTVHISPLDSVFFIVALSALAADVKGSLNLVTRNVKYYAISGLYLISVLLSAIFSSNPSIPIKELIQLTFYLWILPLVLVYKPDIPRVYALGGRILTLLFASILPFYFLHFGWSRFDPIRLQPNNFAFLMAFFTLILAHSGYVWTAVLSLFTTSFAFSRSALGSLSLTFLFKGFLDRKRISLNHSMSALAIFFLLTSPYMLRGYLHIERYLIGKHVSTLERPPIDLVRGKSYEILRPLMWEASFRMWLKKPIFGIGLGRYPQEWEKECRSGNLPERVCVRWVKNVDPHNFFLYILSETGIVGLLTFSLFMLFVFLRVRKSTLALSVLMLTFLFALLQPFPLMFRNFAPLIWLLLFHEGVISYQLDH